MDGLVLVGWLIWLGLVWLADWLVDSVDWLIGKVGLLCVFFVGLLVTIAVWIGCLMGWFFWLDTYLSIVKNGYSYVYRIHQNWFP